MNHAWGGSLEPQMELWAHLWGPRETVQGTESGTMAAAVKPFPLSSTQSGHSSYPGLVAKKLRP